MSNDTTIKRYGILSDTHGKLHPNVAKALEGVDHIFHCGDIGDAAILYELQAIAPVSAVAGNMDPWPLASTLPDTYIEIEAFGKVVMCHGAQFSHNNTSIAQGIRALHGDEKPRLILFGHSHEPIIKKQGKTLIINPGSATLPVSGEPATIVILKYEPNSNYITAVLTPVNH
jgi:uncharacterized protein